jgi:hypothetical protein
MAKPSQQKRESRELQAEALKIARSRQLPGQTKEQTRLIAQGIQKGIEQYKKQESRKARELDKRLKKARLQGNQTEETRIEIVEKPVYRRQWLPWILLAMALIAIGILAFVRC